MVQPLSHEQTAKLRSAIEHMQDGMLRAQIELHSAYDEALTHACRMVGDAQDAITLKVGDPIYRGLVAIESESGRIGIKARDFITGNGIAQSAFAQHMRAENARQLKEMLEAVPGNDSMRSRLGARYDEAVNIVSTLGLPIVLDTGLKVFRATKGVGVLALVTGAAVMQDIGVGAARGAQELLEQAAGLQVSQDMAFACVFVVGAASLCMLGKGVGVSAQASLNGNREEWNQRLDGWRERLGNTWGGYIAKAIAWGQNAIFNPLASISPETQSQLRSGAALANGFAGIPAAEVESIEAIQGVLTKQFGMRGARATAVAAQLLGTEESDANRLSATLKSRQLPAEWIERYGFDRVHCVVDDAQGAKPDSGAQAFREGITRVAAAVDRGLAEPAPVPAIAPKPRGMG